MSATPRQYAENLENNIVTMEMLEDCIFSCNKRAKNYRDKAYNYRSNDGYKYKDYNKGLVLLYRKKDQYYRMKEKLLSFIKPKCIHVESKRQNQHIRFYEHEPEYGTFGGNRVVPGCYWDYDKQNYVEYQDIYVESEIQLYYLYYETPNKSFHTPIYDIKKYPNLEVVQIDNLDTHGEDTHKLVSVQFCNTILNILQSAEYSLIA